MIPVVGLAIGLAAGIAPARAGAVPAHGAAMHAAPAHMAPMVAVPPYAVPMHAGQEGTGQTGVVQEGVQAGAEAGAGDPGPAEGTDTRLERLTREVASRLRCPVCQGLSIEDSPDDLARSMRAVVREQLAAGKSPDEVTAYFVSKYGEWILLEPAARGLNLAVYVLPVLGLALGAGVVVRSVRRWTRVPPPAGESGPDA